MNPDTVEFPFAQGPEKSVLSSILNEPRILARARAEGITADHFHQHGLRTLFVVLMERDAAGQSNDLIELAQRLHESGQLDEIGGPGALSEIYTYAPNGAYFDGHVQILREHLAKRIALKAALGIMEDAGLVEPERLTEALRKATEDTATALSADAGVMTSKQAGLILMQQMQEAATGREIPGIPTGLDPIDIVTGGMRPGELWVVAAEPSGGKSVLMLQAAAKCLQNDLRVLVISLEMDAGVVAARMISCANSIPLRVFTHPREAKKIDLQMAQRGMQNFAEAPLSIHDRGGLTMDRIAGIAKAEADRHGCLDLLVVDYIQLVEGNRGRNETREQEVAAISRGLKALAKQLRIPVFTASQLNDQGRLRESRAIGQDADVVLIIQEDGILGLKVRNGQRGQTFPLKLNGAIQRFERAGKN